MCFGLLIQAKKLNGQPGRWGLDFAYPNGTGRQVRSLLAAADMLDVPAAYVLYFGARSRRPKILCKDNDPVDCWRCERASIGVLPALLANGIVRDNSLGKSKTLVARDAYRRAVLLDELAICDSMPIHDVNLRHVGPELRAFLMDEQLGASAVAKRVLRCVSDVRRGQFAAAMMERMVSTADDAVFQDVPADRGHFGVLL